MLAEVTQCFVLPDKSNMSTEMMFFCFACICSLWSRLYANQHRSCNILFYVHDNFTATLCCYKNQRDYDEFIIWDITSCSLLKVNRRFGGTCLYHLQGWRLSQARNWRQSRLLVLLPPALMLVSLLGLFFRPEDSDIIFLQNVGWLSMDYMALHPRR
jgi:hypothetical protein